MADLLVWRTPIANGASGSLLVYFGENGSFPAAPSQVIVDAGTNSNFGYGATGVGDVNGDGIGDVVVPIGAGQVFYGSRVGLAQVANAVLPVPANARPGSVRGGDVNGDGISDVILSTLQTTRALRPGDPGERAHVFVFQGAVGGVSLVPMVTIDGPMLTRSVLDDFTDLRFGEALIADRDVNGDGVDDIIVGAAGTSPMGLINSGNLFFHAGSLRGLSVVPALELQGLSNSVGLGGVLASRSQQSGRSTARTSRHRLSATSFVGMPRI